MSIKSSSSKFASGAPPRLSLKGALSGKPLPDMMYADVKGTWAYDTMSRRVVDDILPRIMKDNNDECTNPTSPERSECLLKMEDLISSLRCQENGFLRTIKDVGPDCDYWDSVLSDIPEGERNWLKAPWVYIEESQRHFPILKLDMTLSRHKKALVWWKLCHQ